MNVRPARYEHGRTVWQPDVEPGDTSPPRDSLWMEGYVRSISACLEAVWLALTFSPFAARLTVPGPISHDLCNCLSRLTGVPIIGSQLGDRKETTAGPFSATIVRDSFDDMLLKWAREPTTFVIASHHDLGGLHHRSLTLTALSNAGSLRRYAARFDCLGELAAAAMMAPSLGINTITALLCRDELGGIDDGALRDAFVQAG